MAAKIMSPKNAGSGMVADVIGEAQKQSWSEWQLSSLFVHPGMQGSIRERAVQSFLKRHLPSGLEVASGKVIDQTGNQSRQVDILVFDAILNQPLLRYEDGTVLLPAEALLAAIEVKSKLTRAKLREAIEVSASLDVLKPNKKSFIRSRDQGQPAKPGEFRLFFSLFAFESSLGKKSWLQREWQRFKSATASYPAGDPIQRLLVLDRGLILPAERKAFESQNYGRDSLHAWLLHLQNYIFRERDHRRGVDWTPYLSSPGNLKYLS